jgi:hypothetical protein
MQGKAEIAVTSNMWIELEPPKIADANCNHSKILTPDPNNPPRNINSLRRARIAAPEKHTNAKPVPRKAVARTLKNPQINTQNVRKEHQSKVFISYLIHSHVERSQQ